MLIILIKNCEEIKFIVNLNYFREIDTIFKETIAYEGLQYGCKQILLVKDSEI